MEIETVGRYRESVVKEQLRPQDLERLVLVVIKENRLADFPNSNFFGPSAERVCCLLVLNLVSCTLTCIRQPRQRLLI